MRGGGALLPPPRPTHKGALAVLVAARTSAGDVLLLSLPTTRGGKAGTLSASVASGGDLRPQFPLPMSTARLDASTYETIEEREVELNNKTITSASVHTEEATRRELSVS